MQVQLDTSQNEGLVLKMLIENTSSRSLRLNPHDVVLLSRDERRHEALQVDAEAAQLAPGQEISYRWEYRPINDLFLYQRSGLHGNFLQEYRLPLSFVGGIQDTLLFCFQEEAFLQYSRKMARKEPVLYFPSKETTAPQMAARQEEYWSKISGIQQHPEAGSAYFSEQEFFSAGINLKHALYQKGDSLYLQLQLINHAPYLLSVNPANITVQAGGEQHKPARIMGPPSPEKQEYQLRKGERLPLTLAFPAPKTDSLQLSFGGIQVQELKKPLFYSVFSFVRQ